MELTPPNPFGTCVCAEGSSVHWPWAPGLVTANFVGILFVLTVACSLRSRGGVAFSRRLVFLTGATFFRAFIFISVLIKRYPNDRRFTPPVLAITDAFLDYLHEGSALLSKAKSSECEKTQEKFMLKQRRRSTDNGLALVLQ